MKNLLFYTFAVVLTGFGLLTLFLSSSVIFDLFGIRAKEGNYVLFVVWSNFISSILYLLAVYAFVKRNKWSARLLAISLLILCTAFAGLLVYAADGGIHESKTIGAMVFRISFTLIAWSVPYFVISRPLQLKVKTKQQSLKTK